VCVHGGGGFLSGGREAVCCLEPLPMWRARERGRHGQAGRCARLVHMAGVLGRQAGLLAMQGQQATQQQPAAPHLTHTGSGSSGPTGPKPFQLTNCMTRPAGTAGRGRVEEWEGRKRAERERCWRQGCTQR
jgi:hypothetical protein